MEKTKFQLYYDSLTHSDIEHVRFYFSKEENLEMNRKMNELLSTMKFTDFDSQAAVEKAFTIGYLSAHVLYPEQVNEKIN